MAQWNAVRAGAFQTRENNYKSTINVSIESVEEIGIEEQAAEEETNKNEGLLQGIMNNAQKVAEKVTSSVSDGVEKAKQIEEILMK